MQPRIQAQSWPLYLFERLLLVKPDLNARSLDSDAESQTQVASAIPPASCTEAVQGAVDAGAVGLNCLN